MRYVSGVSVCTRLFVCTYVCACVSAACIRACHIYCACVAKHACMCARAWMRVGVCVCVRCAHAHIASLYWLKLRWGNLVICFLHALPGYSFSWHTRICIKTETKEHVCPFCWWQLRRNCMYNSKIIRWVSFEPRAVFDQPVQTHQMRTEKCKMAKRTMLPGELQRERESLLQSVVTLDARTHKPVFLFQRLRIHLDAQIDFCFLEIEPGIIQH